ncbi:GPI anchored serine-threonine rich family protein, partial [Aspergillus homomorphus CBS 101889]
IKMQLTTALLLTALTALTRGSPTQKPAYSITSPTSGAILTPNTPSVISWTTTQRSSAKLSLHVETTTNHTSLYTIATNITNSGSISWSPPARLPPGSEYIIVIDPSSGIDTDTSTTTSNNNDATTYYPTENQPVTRGKTTILTWPVEKETAHVSVYLMEGASSTDSRNVSTVATHVANSGSLACVLPGKLTLADDYRFAVVDVDDAEKVKYSATFRVVGEDEDDDAGDDEDKKGDENERKGEKKNETDGTGDDSAAATG